MICCRPNTIACQFCHSRAIIACIPVIFITENVFFLFCKYFFNKNVVLKLLYPGLRCRALHTRGVIIPLIGNVAVRRYRKYSCCGCITQVLLQLNSSQQTRGKTIRNIYTSRTKECSIVKLLILTYYNCIRTQRMQATHGQYNGIMVLHWEEIATHMSRVA